MHLNFVSQFFFFPDWFFNTPLRTHWATWGVGNRSIKLQTDSQQPEQATPHIGGSQLLYMQWPFCLHHNLMWGGFHWWVVVWARTIAYPYPTGSYWQNSQRSDLHPCKGSCPPVIWKKGGNEWTEKNYREIEKEHHPSCKILPCITFWFPIIVWMVKNSDKLKPKISPLFVTMPLFVTYGPWTPQRKC